MTHQNNHFTSKVQQYTEQIRAGDLASLSSLFDVAGVRLVRYATGITGNQHDGEDIVQAVLTKVATEPNLILDRDCSWAYLLRMTRNAAVDLLRRQSRSKVSDKGTLKSVVVQTEYRLENDTKQKIWVAMNRLPREQREVILLKIWEQMTFEEVATILQLAPGTVASRYRYAINKLRHSLASISVERSQHEIRS